jgi:antitoxin ParD1/3/4
MKSEGMRTLTVSLSPKLIDRLHKAVETGNYASNSEVIRDALRLWEQREQLRELEIANLKRAYREGMRSGKPREVDGPAFLAELKAGRQRA